MMGTSLVANYPVVILFDSGASHTFISKNFVEKHCIPCTESREGFIIHSPRGQIFTKEIVFHVLVTLAEREFPTNMIVFKGQDLDVILGLNWLAQHKAILNTDLRTIKLSHGHEEVLLSIPVPSRLNHLAESMKLSYKKSRIFRWYVNSRMFFLKTCLGCLLKGT
jgi:hypothetical protein